MKIYQWLNKYNYKISLKILEKYSRGRSLGKSSLYALDLSFWPIYIGRLLLVFAEIILLKKSAYKNASNLLFNKQSYFYSPDEHSVIHIKLADIFATLFGFRYHIPPGIFPISGDIEILKSKLKITGQTAPLVSIIIPVHNQLKHTYNCLQSIQHRLSSAYPFEIIVVNNASTDQTGLFFQNNVEGVIYIESKQYLGHTQACKLGIESSNGTLICLLDQHIQVGNNWLERLVETIGKPETGCVGSKIIFKNGLLKQAGGILYPDGSKVDYGAHADAGHPLYNYTRTVDYCSASSLMFRKVDLEQYDMTFGEYLRKSKIIYQPLSTVIDCTPSYETNSSSSYPTIDIDTYVRKYQTGKTILFIDDVIPAPDQDSGSNRLFKIMRIVKSLGYHIIFVPDDGKKRGHYFDQMVLEGFEVWYRFPNRQGMIKILSETLAHIDAAWICKPHNNEHFKFIFEAKKDCLWIYDTIDLHFLRLQREGELAGNTALLESALKVKQTELSIGKQADITIAITNDEKLMLNKESIEHVVVIPNIHESEKTDETACVFSKRKGILFIGGYLHSPNVDAVRWLVKQIMPEVWKTDPTIKLTLLGSNPTEEVLALRSENIAVPGYIKDVSPYFNGHRVFVAPLRFGAGMKGKIGQSLEYGLPIVSTGIGVEGMDLIDGHNVLVGEETVEFATKILQLYQSQELWNKIRNNSIQALDAYSPGHVTQKVEELFKKLNLLNSPG